MRYDVRIQAVGDDGIPVWGYSHTEVFVATDDAEENALRLCAQLLRRVDEGRRAIAYQAGIDLPLLAAERESGTDHGNTD